MHEKITSWSIVAMIKVFHIQLYLFFRNWEFTLKSHVMLQGASYLLARLIFKCLHPRNKSSLRIKTFNGSITQIYPSNLKALIRLLVWIEQGPRAIRSSLKSTISYQCAPRDIYDKSPNSTTGHWSVLFATGRFLDQEIFPVNSPFTHTFALKQIKP